VLLCMVDGDGWEQDDSDSTEARIFVTYKSRGDGHNVFDFPVPRNRVYCQSFERPIPEIMGPAIHNNSSFYSWAGFRIEV